MKPETHWQSTMRTVRPFPDQSKLRYAAMAAFDAFVPENIKCNPDKKNLGDITDRLDAKKHNALNDMLMMKSIDALCSTLIMDAMGSTMNGAHLNGFDGPLNSLASSLKLSRGSLTGLVPAMKEAIAKEINDYRLNQPGFPRAGTAWQQAQGSAYRYR